MSKDKKRNNVFREAKEGGYLDFLLEAIWGFGVKLIKLILITLGIWKIIEWIF